MSRAAGYRDAFDGGFAAALPPPDPARRDFLCVRIAGDPYAIALGEVASLHAGVRIVALPSRARAMLGVAAIRAAVVPIYDLRIAFGASDDAPPRWVVLDHRGAAGFAFDGFDGHVRIPEAAVSAATRSGHLRGQFTLDGVPRSVVDLTSVLTTIERT